MKSRLFTFLRNDWRWHLALLAFAGFTYVVVLEPFGSREPPSPPVQNPAAPVADAAAAVDPDNPLVMNEEDCLHYTVQEGDTVESIARLFCVSEAAMRRQNGFFPDEEVASGRRILIPPAE